MTTTYTCPKCGYSTNQRPGVEVTHACPKAKTRGTMVLLKEAK